MIRKVRRVLLTSTVVLGISAMVPPEATARLFRGRGASNNSCQPVCCTPMVNQASYYGNASTTYSSASYASYQPSNCCDTYASDTQSSGSDQTASQYPKESFDAQGNRIDAGTQLNSQQRLDAQGNPIDADLRSDLGSTQLETNSDQSGVLGSADVGLESPVSRDR